MSNTSNNPIVRSEQLRALVAGVIEELKSEQVGVKTVLLAPYGAQWLAEGGETLKEGDVVVIKNSSITRVGFIGEVPADPYFGVGIVTREIGTTSPTCDIVAFDNTHQLIYLELSFDGGWIRQSFSLDNFLTTATANETYLKKTEAAGMYRPLVPVFHESVLTVDGWEGSITPNVPFEQKFPFLDDAKFIIGGTDTLPNWTRGERLYGTYAGQSEYHYEFTPITTFSGYLAFENGLLYYCQKTGATVDNGHGQMCIYAKLTLIDHGTVTKDLTADEYAALKIKHPNTTYNIVEE